MHRAGPERRLVIAVDDKAQSLNVADLAQKYFPSLQIVARSRDVTHWLELRDRGVMLVQREMFESSVLSARSVLALLGRSTEHVEKSAHRFRQHNLALFETLRPHYKDSAKLIATVKQGHLQLEEQMVQERAHAAKRP